MLTSIPEIHVWGQWHHLFYISLVHPFHPEISHSEFFQSIALRLLQWCCSIFSRVCPLFKVNSGQRSLTSNTELTVTFEYSEYTVTLGNCTWHANVEKSWWSSHVELNVNKLFFSSLHRIIIVHNSKQRSLSYLITRLRREKRKEKKKFVHIAPHASSIRISQH